MKKIYSLRPPIILSLLLCTLTLYICVNATVFSNNDTPSEAIGGPIILVVEPKIIPGWAENCETYWMKYPTTLGGDAYLTLNVNSPSLSTNHGEWHPDILLDGYYQVEAYLPYHDPITWCSGNIKDKDTADAHYSILHSLGTSEVVSSQEILTDTWLDLGTYLFTGGENSFVSLDDVTNEANYQRTIIFSTMRFTYLAPAQELHIPLVQWQITTDPSAVFETQVLTAHGFDACQLPSVSQMQNWWHNSPYEIYGLYLGGASLSAGCPRANASWVNQVRAQGWSFVPTWVGLQAPCSVYKNKFSYDPIIANQEGRSEADLALQAAFYMGVVSQFQNKTIVYYDLEGYSTASLECRAAAQAFIDGWVSRLHELGHHAGVYGGVCTSYATDWASLSNTPDAVWLAAVYSETYTEIVPLKGLPCVNDKLWSNHQRIRQYAFDYTDSWGGVSLGIDSDYADAEVAIPGGVLTSSVSSAAVQLLTPHIQAYQLLDTQFGWIIVDDIFFTTNDQGITWNQMDFPSVLNAYFLNDLTGFLIGGVGAENGSWFLYKTYDQGTTWQKIDLPTPDHQPGWQPISIVFTSDNLGEISFQKITSSAFHITATSTTTDGGINWQSEPNRDDLRMDENQALYRQLVSPSAFPELHNMPGTSKNGFFLDSHNGWIATIDSDCSGEKGSVNFTCWRQENLWMTSDAGHTWEPIYLPAPSKK